MSAKNPFPNKLSLTNPKAFDVTCIFGFYHSTYLGGRVYIKNAANPEETGDPT
jgi:hypothetical protein